ncbi:CDGSH iron-sulfur domain-containing protein [Cyanobium sp. ATX 6F1]|nr:CDGSH iron-sulfur domain-containing protein [Cyanobium sp. ATX 6F1]
MPLSEQSIVVNAAGDSIDYQQGRLYPSQATFELCRCGQSSTKPFCDGTHATVSFDGTTTCSHAPYLEQAETIAGPVLSITDAKALCSNARFCDPHGGIWALVKQSDEPDAHQLVVFQASHCPSGRLIAWERATGQSIESAHPPSIALIVDTKEGVNGPIWVRGGIPIHSEMGLAYEVRQQCTLCRCGRSANKPFCDGAHTPTHSA